ncbi:MAG: diguanylate cyclase [Ilumatobacter sp.]
MQLRLDVTVECVETAAQHSALTSLGCVAAQGFLYSGDREPADLYQPIRLPDRRLGVGFPYPHDETGRLEALHRADVLDTPAEEVYDDIVRAAANSAETPISLVSLIDEDRQWFKAKVGLDADQTPRDVAFCAHAICSEDLMEVPDAHDDDRFASNPLVLDDPNVRFYAGVPLRAAAGYSYGTLCVIDTVPRVLTLDQRVGLARLARQVTVLLELRESINQLSHAYGQLELAHRERDAVEASLRHQAHYDRLTGLPNRALLMARIETAFAASVSTGQPFATLICDLDDFKFVNDGLGHPAGDQLLVEVARRPGSVGEEHAVRHHDGAATAVGEQPLHQLHEQPRCLGRLRSRGEVGEDRLLLLSPERRIRQNHVDLLGPLDLLQRPCQRVATHQVGTSHPMQQQVHHPE